MECESKVFQAVRLVDVFILGPIMIRAGAQMSGPAGSFLAFAGLATIVFNGVTFLQIQRRAQEQ